MPRMSGRKFHTSETFIARNLMPAGTSQQAHKMTKIVKKRPDREEWLMSAAKTAVLSEKYTVCIASRDEDAPEQ